jgi:hypothetical protein
MTSKFLSSIEAIPPFAEKTAAWRTVPEPKLHPLVTGLLPIPPFFLVMWLFTVTPTALSFSQAGLPAIVGGFFFAGVLHELLHGIACPGFGLSSKTRFGFDKKFGVLFCVHLGPMTAPRLYLMTLLPFFVLTAAPLLSAFLGYSSGFLCVVATYNAGMSVVDLYTPIFIARAVPWNALIAADGVGNVYLPPTELAQTKK